MRTSSFLAAAAKNALAVGAYEEVLRLIESELMLLPADKTKDRASALALRGDAFAGLGRRDEARSAWGVAAQRFEDSGDKRSASAIRSRLHASPAEKVGGTGEQAVQEPVAEASGDGHEAQTSAEPVADAQATSRAENGTGA
jgi:hypothetical protein